MAVLPPADRLTKIPASIVDLLQRQFNLLTDQTINQMKRVIQDTTQLPKNSSCDDPKTQQIKNDLQLITKNLQTLQDTFSVVISITSQISALVKTGSAIKNAIAVAQLSNPVTAGLFTASQIENLQNELIANALQSITPLESIPQQSLAKIETLSPALITAIGKINNTCNENIELVLPVKGDSESSVDETVAERPEFPPGFDYNDLLPSDFYRDVNVSNQDLQQRADTIQQLVQQQQNLLTSLLEAPSQVYKQDGVPPGELGKTGDFYVDTQNNIAYGPKPTDNEWGGPLN